MTFDAPGLSDPIALLVDYWSLAGAIWLNGALLDQDANLVEPLSRSWNVSRVFHLSPPMLRGGENTVLVRVSGLSAFQPGLGSVTVGNAEALRTRFADAQFLRRGIPMFTIAFTLALAFFFLIIWSLRRREAAYGWYALMSLGWAGYSFNQIATTPWPLNTSMGWSQSNMVMFMLCCVAFFMFSVRLCGRRFPRLERALFFAFFLAIGWLLLARDFAATRIILSMIFVAVYLAGCMIFFAVTYNARRLDFVALNIVNATILLGAIYDILVLSDSLPGTIYISPITTQLRVVSMAFVLAWHFVASLTCIERFNQELVEKIASAKQELAVTLSEQHELALSNSRQSERISLLHDLHDGLGGTLVNNIALLEHTPEKLVAGRFLSILKELREELRIVVDTSTRQDHEPENLADWLAPIRSRYVLLCENRDISCKWQLEGLENCYLPFRHSLELARMLQECVTNALKHGEPHCITVNLVVEERSLRIRVEDDGVGFDVGQTASGTGLQSLRMRSRRLNGQLVIESRPGATIIAATIPIPD